MSKSVTFHYGEPAHGKAFYMDQLFPGPEARKWALNWVAMAILTSTGSHSIKPNGNDGRRVQIEHDVE